jgi:signal transduction histidine kinase
LKITLRAGERRSWAKWAFLLFGAATLLGVLFASRTYVLYSFYPDRAVTLGEALFPALTDVYVWALLVPAMYWLVARWPIGGASWPQALGIHLGSAALAAALKWALDFGVSQLAGWMQPMPLATPAFIFNFYANFISYWIIVAVLHAIDFGIKYRDRQVKASQLEAKLAQVQLQVLRMQLQPHFLFNTLHAISTLMHRDVDAADRMLAQLSDLLRLTIEKIGVHEVSLREELEFLRSYLKIEETRFQDRLSVEFNVDAETLDARVPNLILQPLVENSIRHGFTPRKGPGVVQVRATRNDGRLELVVRDNGPGISDGPEAPSGGLGLANIRARLAQRYGAAHSLNLENHPSGGLVVTVSIPFQSDSDSQSGSSDDGE